MPEILLLVGDTALARNDNHERFPRGFRQAGWTVTSTSHDDLAVRANQLSVGDRSLADFDLIWPLGFGRQVTFLDRMQLLEQIPASRFLVTPAALTWLHGKHRWLKHMPETYTSTDPGSLLAAIGTGGDWIIKPTAGSYGRDVHRVGSVAEARDVLNRLHDDQAGYLMAQRFVPEVVAGEKRTLVAGGRIIGSYLRQPESAVTANVSTGARTFPATLSARETVLITSIAADLAGLGAGFAAVDIVYPWLMEVNVANPGGLATLEALSGVDETDAVVRALLDWKAVDPPLAR